MKFSVNEVTFMNISKDQLIEVKKLRDLKLPTLDPFIIQDYRHPIYEESFYLLNSIIL